MKKVLLALLVVACGTTVSAQTNLSSTKVSSTKEVKMQDDKQNQQIADAILKNEDLQDVTIEHLNNDKKTQSAMEKIFAENEGDKSGMIKSILGNKKLATVAIDYIKNNPDLLKKAMSVVGM